MSRYLVDRIEASPAIEVRVRHPGRGVPGQRATWSRWLLARPAAGVEEEVPADWLFVFIGAAPRTDWLGGEVRRDDHGFVVTGPDLRQGLSEDQHGPWALPRAPYALETSVPGVFAAGDVRLDSMKRVASAVGEGAMAVHLVHRYLATV